MTKSRTRERVLSACALAFAIAACGPGENDPGPGGVTVGEAQALDEAAAMLEDRKLPADAIGSGAAETGEGDPPPVEQ
ncbi:hypothetical protein ACXYL9_00805 [Qipengyuania sp. CAU 1752]